MAPRHRCAFVRRPSPTRCGARWRAIAASCLLAAAWACGSSPRPSPSADRASASTTDPTSRGTRHDAAGVEQVWVPAGSFAMGTDATGRSSLLALHPPGWVVRELPSEQPRHLVRITSGFWIDKYEVTNEAFSAFVAAGGYTRRTLWSDGGWAWLRR